ncbi:MAG: hypothetical protein QXS16_01470 [Pyrobaculum sp.]
MSFTPRRGGRLEAPRLSTLQTNFSNFYLEARLPWPTSKHSSPPAQFVYVDDTPLTRRVDRAHDG